MLEILQSVSPVPPGTLHDEDFSNPWLLTENQAVVIAGVVICTFCLGLRVYTKVFLLHGFGWDDACIIGAWVFSIVTQALCLYGYDHGGIGLHIWNITPEMFLSFQKGIFAAGIVYVPALGLAKASLIILYYRIMSLERPYRWALYIIGLVVVGYSIAITFALIFACKPISKAWNAELEGTCVDQNALYAATAVTNTVTDVALIIVPIPIVAGLNLPVIQKIGIFFMFIVGCATVITSVIRLVTLFPFLDSEDKTYQIAWTDLWMYESQHPSSSQMQKITKKATHCSNIEANFIIICACIPFLRHFLRRYAPWLIGEGSSAARYFRKRYRDRDYNVAASTSRRSWRRKRGLTRLQDDVELAENGALVGGGGLRITTEMQWDVTSDRAIERSRSPSPSPSPSPSLAESAYRCE